MPPTPPPPPGAVVAPPDDDQVSDCTSVSGVSKKSRRGKTKPGKAKRAAARTSEGVVAAAKVMAVHGAMTSLQAMPKADAVSVVCTVDTDTPYSIDLFFACALFLFVCAIIKLGMYLAACTCCKRSKVVSPKALPKPPPPSPPSDLRAKQVAKMDLAQLCSENARLREQVNFLTVNKLISGNSVKIEIYMLDNCEVYHTHRDCHHIRTKHCSRFNIRRVCLDCAKRVLNDEIPPSQYGVE